MKRILLLCTLLTMQLTAVMGTAQTMAVITFSSTEGGEVVASTLDYREVQSGDKLAVGTEVALQVKVLASHYLKGWLINGAEDHAYQINIRYIVQEGENNLQALVYLYPPEGFKVTYKAGTGGQIVGAWYMDESSNWISFASGELVPIRRPVRLQAEPNEGYKIDQWFVNGQALGGYDGSTWLYTTTRTPLDNIEVTFKKVNAYKVNFSIDAAAGKMQATYPKNNWDTQIQSGAVLPQGTQVTFFVFPNDGYEMEKWIVNGVDVPLDNDYPQRLQKVLQEDLTVTPILKKTLSMHQVRLHCGSGGRIEGQFVDEEGYTCTFDSQKEIQEGVQLTVRAIPNPNWSVDKWTYNNQEVQPSADDPNLYIFTVTESADVSVTFKEEAPADYPVTWTVEGGRMTVKYEKVKGSGDFTFPKSGDRIIDGTEVIFTVLPDDNNVVKEWYVNQSLRKDLAGQTETTITIESETSVRVICKPITYKLSYTAGTNGSVVAKDTHGSVIASGTDVDINTHVTLTATPDEGYELAQWVVNGTPLSDKALSIELTIDKAYTVEVSFVKKVIEYSVSFALLPADKGTLTVTNTQTQSPIVSGSKLPEGSEISCQVVIPDGSKWQLEKWVINGVDYTEGTNNNPIKLIVSKDLEIKAVLLDHSSVDTPTGSNYTISVENGLLIINGLTVPTQVSLYSTDGKLVLSRQSEGNTVSISELPQGIYYLLLEGLTYRVIK